MPFDGAGCPQYPALQKLEAVTRLLAREDRWCKGSLRSPDGRYCLMGAMQAVEAQALLEPALLRAIREVTGRRFLRIVTFNDRPGTTHAMVLMVLRRAGERIVLTGAASPPAPGRVRRRLRPLATWVAQRMSAARHSLPHS